MTSTGNINIMTITLEFAFVTLNIIHVDPFYSFFGDTYLSLLDNGYMDELRIDDIAN